LQPIDSFHHRGVVENISRPNALKWFVLVWTILFLFPGTSIAQANNGVDTQDPTEKIGHAVIQFLKRNNPWRDAEVQIQDVRIPGNIGLLPSNDEFSVVAAANARYLGHTPVEIVFRSNSGERRVWASAYVEVLENVVVARRSMERNETISEDDVSLVKRDLAKVPPGAILDVRDAVGQKLKLSVGPGTILKKSMVDMPPLVKSGDVVTLVVETDTLKITALGKVEQTGAEGDTVQVINLTSKKRVYGEVIDKRTVQVRY
jgi:flagella basal body P-ring formation protein FlgA